MFIEVYVIPVSDWNDNEDEIMVDKNRHLISLTSILRIQPSADPVLFDRAEIVMSDGRRYYVIGSYEEIIKRVESQAAITRI